MCGRYFTIVTNLPVEADKPLKEENCLYKRGKSCGVCVKHCPSGALSLGEDLKKIMLAGIGAVAITSEKSAELIDDLVKKGQVTVEQGKELNEELKRNLKTKVQDAVNEHVNVTVVTNEEEK